MTDPERRAVQQRTMLPVILVLALVVVVLSALLWYFTVPPREPAVSPAVSFEPPAPTAPAPLSEPTFRDVPAPPSPADIWATTPAPATVEPEPEDRCATLSRRLTAFFNELDTRDYIQARQLEEPAAIHLGRLLDRLLAQPPVVSGETDSLFAILNNTAHLYRVLQKDNLLLVKEIMEREGRQLEEVLDLFYQWSLVAPGCPPGTGVHLPLPATYEYAAFFLNTLGGRSYIFRRDTRTRLLAQYYAVLILDQANEAGINRHGLDIRPAINSLLGEMAGRDDLKTAAEYRAVLTELQDKYSRQYGK